jgi:hypothetical protein
VVSIDGCWENEKACGAAVEPNIAFCIWGSLKALVELKKLWRGERSVRHTRVKILVGISNRIMCGKSEKI